LAASDWTHAAHIGVAAYYAFNRGPFETYAAMKAGLLRFNAAVGTKNTDHSGYHETLTRFWSYLIWKFVRERCLKTRFDSVRCALAELTPNRRLPEDYYGFNVRDCARCRQMWVAPNPEFAAEMERSGALADLVIGTLGISPSASSVK
jgi:hypothetical protein